MVTARPPSAVGIRLKLARERKKFGLRQLADMSGVSAATISRLERGYASLFSVVDALRTALDLTWDELSGENCKHDFACTICGISLAEVDA